MSQLEKTNLNKKMKKRMNKNNNKKMCRRNFRTKSQLRNQFQTSQMTMILYRMQTIVTELVNSELN